MGGSYSQSQLILVVGGRRLVQLAKDGKYSIEPLQPSQGMTEGNNGDASFFIDVRKGIRIKVQLMPDGSDSAYLAAVIKAARTAKTPAVVPMEFADPLTGRSWTWAKAVCEGLPSSELALEVGSEEWSFVGQGERES